MAAGEDRGPSVKDWGAIFTLGAGWDAFEVDVAWCFCLVISWHSHLDCVASTEVFS